MRYVSKKINLLVIILFVALSLTSCAIKLIPDYDSEISTQIDNVSKQTDKFYLSISEKTSEGDSAREYKNYIDEYIEIEVELISLLNKNKIRPLNKNSTKISEIALQIWQKYKNEHRQYNLISNADITLNRKYFSDLFYAMKVAENAKKVIQSDSN